MMNASTTRPSRPPVASYFLFFPLLLLKPFTIMSAEQVANAFVQHYYQTFDSNVQQLAQLFTQNSMMTFEGQPFQGAESIVQKLTNMGKITHEIKSTDVQPSATENCIVIFVTGNLRIDGGNPLHFCEFFQLISTGPGQYSVHNCIFRLNYA
ncbi:hypothetical protein MPSEU_000412000 [Mayamaea pseudoterrestris]|nr:hypothetical protein MPSEU_000412000 [Mayamaea pseudoterrestris]